MRTSRGRNARSALLVALPLAAVVVAACQQATTVVGRVSPRTGRGFLQTNVHVTEDGNQGTFQFDGEVAEFRCSATVIGTGGPRRSAETVAITVAARGNAGVPYEVKCTDPLILQFPLDAHSFRAVGKADWGQADLPVRAGLSSIPVAPGRTLDAEPNHQLVEVDYTPNLPPALYRLRLDFALSSPRSIEVKALVVGEVSCGGQLFLPPVLPQVDSFGELPGFELPLRRRPARIQPEVSGLPAEVSTLIDCTTAGPAGPAGF